MNADGGKAASGGSALSAARSVCAAEPGASNKRAEPPAAAGALPRPKPYHPPVLRELGTVADLTCTQPAASLPVGHPAKPTGM